MSEHEIKVGGVKVNMNFRKVHGTKSGSDFFDIEIIVNGEMKKVSVEMCDVRGYVSHSR